MSIRHESSIEHRNRIATAHHHAQFLASVLLAVATWALLLITVPALAHVPDIETGTSGEVTLIGGPEVSRAIYGFVGPSETHDDYRFTVSEPVTRTIGILVPEYPEHAGFRPELVLMTEGAEPVVLEDPGITPRESEWEPFSLARFYNGGETEVGFTPGTEYLLRVQPGAGSPSGRYVIVFGGPEQFSGAEVAATVVQLPTIWFGAYGDAPARWNSYALIPILVGAALLGFAVSWVVVRVSKRRHRESEG